MTTAEQAVNHVLRQMQSNPRLAYYLGYGTRSYELLTEAGAQIAGRPVEEFRAAFEKTYTTERPA